jgi:hypothetical protein
MTGSSDSNRSESQDGFREEFSAKEGRSKDNDHRNTNRQSGCVQVERESKVESFKGAWFTTVESKPLRKEASDEAQSSNHERAEADLGSIAWKGKPQQSVGVVARQHGRNGT